MKNIGILGDGGFAREVFFLIDQINKETKIWNVCAFFVEKPETRGAIFGVPILNETEIPKFNDLYLVTGMGTPAIKRKATDKLSKLIPDVGFATLIHPDVEAAMTPSYGDQALRASDGVIVTAGNILTVNISLGRHVHLNLDCTVGHDSRIDDYATVSPGVHISGNVHIGEGAFIGTGASIIEKKKIGKGSVIGAGACVVSDIPDYTLAVGIPAKVIKEIGHP